MPLSSPFHIRPLASPRHSPAFGTKFKIEGTSAQWSLHRALACALFQRFVHGTLVLLEVLPLSEPGLGTVEQLAVMLYEASKHEEGGRWRRDLDLAERLGAAWQQGEQASLGEVLHGTVLRDAAIDVLRAAHERCCMRR